MKILQFPLARITIFFVLGILFGFYTKPFPTIVFGLLFIVSVIFGLAFYFSKKDFLQKSYFGIITYAFSFIIGITTLVVHTDYFQQNNYIHQCSDENKEHLIEVVLREKLKNSTYNERYIAVVTQLDNKESSGKILLNIEKDSSRINLEIGSNLLIKASIYKHKAPNNPDQFNYGEYLTNKSILAQMYAGPSEIKISTVIDKDIWYYSAKFRNRIIKNLQDSGFGKEELNVISALILGQQQEISSEVLHDYQFAGAVHVLSVSGLHVGYLLLLITLLLSRLPKNNIGNLTRFTVVFISLWGFAIIAGLSPSVVRSVTMFTFISAGMFLKRETNVFHTLLVSLLLILLVAPSFLFDVGFQLSYVSLFFILWLQPMFSGLWIPKNRIVKYFWDILTVSFAAQIGAFPLSIYYFHQFPGLFFVTNLVILPVLGLIMLLGIFVMLLALFGTVPQVLIIVTQYSIFGLDWVINKIASLEQFIIQDIPLNIYMMIAMYLMIIGIIIWFKKPSFKKLAFALSTILIFQISYFSANYYNQNKEEWIVFHSRKNSIIGERKGEEIIVQSNTRILKNSTKNAMLKSYLVANFSKIESEQKLRNVNYFKENKILIIDSLGISAKNINPDVIVITQSPKINLERLFSAHKPKIVIADGSNYKSYIKLWKVTCLKNKIPFHATAEKGFYRIE